MIQEFRILSFIIALFLSSITANAQLQEMGIHFGYNLSKLKVSDNQLNENLSARSGLPVSGGTFGIQFMTGPPKNQNVNHFKIIPSLMFEASLCRCGGKVSLISSVSDSIRSFSNLTFLFYRGDYSAKFVASIKKFQFLAGPTLTNFFYTGVKSDQISEYQGADNQFSSFVMGYELGVGLRLKRVMLSGRFQSHITNFGVESPFLPTELRNHQFKLMLHYFFLQKHRGAYWNSIYWD